MVSTSGKQPDSVEPFNIAEKYFELLNALDHASTKMRVQILRID